MNRLNRIKRIIPPRIRETIKDITGLTALQERARQLEARNSKLEIDIGFLQERTNQLAARLNESIVYDTENITYAENIAYVNKLKNDHKFFVKEVSDNVGRVINHYHKYYQIVPKDYVTRYMEHIKNLHINNPLATQFIDHALGLPSRMRSMVKKLEESGLSLSNKNILDVGCGNGALLLACHDCGAKNLIGVDISRGHLESGKLLVGQKNIQLIELDILSSDLPFRSKFFGIIFCTELLEHVKDVQQVFFKIKKYLSTDINSFAFVTVSNKNNFANIKSEPHYNIPGMILLEHSKAKNLWHNIRKKVNSILEYEVYNWYSFLEYETMANLAGLKVFVWGNNNPEIPIQDYENTIIQFNKELKDMIAELPIDEIFKESLYESLGKYCKEYKKDHHLFAINEYKKLDLYLKYYQQPFYMLLRHA